MDIGISPAKRGYPLSIEYGDVMMRVRAVQRVDASILRLMPGDPDRAKFLERVKFNLAHDLADHMLPHLEVTAMPHDDDTVVYTAEIGLDPKPNERRQPERGYNPNWGGLPGSREAALEGIWKAFKGSTQDYIEQSYSRKREPVATRSKDEERIETLTLALEAVQHYLENNKLQEAFEEIEEALK